MYVTFINRNLEVSKRRRKQNVESQTSFLGKYLGLFAIYFCTKFEVPGYNCLLVNTIKTKVIRKVGQAAIMLFG